MLNFHYIRSGLNKGQKCIYLVLEKKDDHQDDHVKDNDIHCRRGKTGNKKDGGDDQIVEFIKRDMSDSQINVSHLIAEGLLYIGTSRKQLYYYEKMRAKRKGSELFESMLPNSFYNVNESFSSLTQYRLVLDAKPELHTMDYNLADLLELEELYHTIFHSLQGSSICSYFVQNVEQTLTDYSEYGKLMTLRLNSHSGVIFAREFGKGLALALR